MKKILLLLTSILISAIIATIGLFITLTNVKAQVTDLTISPWPVYQTDWTITITIEVEELDDTYYLCANADDNPGECLLNDAHPDGDGKISIEVCGDHGHLRKDCDDNYWFEIRDYTLHVKRGGTASTYPVSFHVWRSYPEYTYELNSENKLEVTIEGFYKGPRLPGGSDRSNLEIHLIDWEDDKNIKCTDGRIFPETATFDDSLDAGEYRFEIWERTGETGPLGCGAGDMTRGFHYITQYFTIAHDGHLIPGERTVDDPSEIPPDDLTPDGGLGPPGENPCKGGICKTALGNIPFEMTAFAGRILSIAIGLAGGIALILLVFGSIRVLTSAGNQQSLAAGRDMIIAAITGLLFLIFSVLILRALGLVIGISL